MSNRVVCDISISAGGYVAGPGQTADKPFGDGPVDRLHAWMFDWDRSWTGWWGDNPPYHAPVFVLTHHPREPLTLRLELLGARAASLTTHIGYRVLR